MHGLAHSIGLFGSVFNCDDLRIDDGLLWLSSTDLATLSHPYFCVANDTKKAKLVINRLEATNTMWNGYDGAWGNGQKVELTVSPTTVDTMWKNFWKLPSKAYGDYTNSLLTGMNLDSTSAGTSQNAFDYYIASTRLQTSADGDKNVLDYVSTENTLVAKSYSTNKDNSMYIYLYADSIPDCAVNTSMGFFVSDASIASDANNPTVSLNVSEGWLDSKGVYTKLQDLIYAPSAKDGARYVNTDGLNVSTRPISTSKSNKFRVEILISNFYTTGTNNEHVFVTLRCPRLEVVHIDRITNLKTV